MFRLARVRGWVPAIAVTMFAACSREDPAPARGVSGPDEIELTTAEAGKALASTNRGAGTNRIPPRRAIAGIAGFQSSSRVVYAAEPNKTHTLSATYLFPERVRIRLALDQGKVIDRVLLYRFGEQGHFIDEGSANSRELVGDELLDLRLQTELRRALFLWPDGFPWRGEGDVRSTELEGLGKLVAQLGVDSKPISIKSFGLAAESREAVRSIHWKAFGPRQFPSQFEWVSAGKVIWNEEVLEVETALNYVEAFFLPPDRRASDKPVTPVAKSATIEAIDLPAVWEFQVELDASMRRTLQTARAAAEAAHLLWTARGVLVQDEAILELDQAGRATGALLRSESLRPPPPEGWVRRAECPAWSMLLERAQDADAAHISFMGAHSAIEARTAKVELHWSLELGGREALQLVLR